MIDAAHLSVWPYVNKCVGHALSMMVEKHTTADRHKQNTCFYVFGGRWRTAEEAEYAAK